MPRWLLLLALIGVPLISGCDGCRKKPDPEAEKKKEKEAPKEDFVGTPSQPFPTDQNQTGSAIKPGHWITASQSLKANNADVRGELQSRIQSRGMSIRQGVESSTQSDLVSRRPAVLPKGQNRRFDFRLLPPMPASSNERTFMIRSRFSSPSQAVFFEPASKPFRLMGSEEYFFVILTSRWSRFSKFNQADWIRPFRDRNDEPTERRNYRIIVPNDDGVLALSDSMLDWTNTAVLLYDDLPPEALTPDQQTAIRDWVHFGGRLIVNGPDSATALQQTSLADLLPLKPTSNIELNPDAAAELLEGWKVKSDRSVDKQIAIVRGNSSRIAIDGTKMKQATVLPKSGGLVMKRTVGSGTVMQPRVDLTSDWLSDWGSYDSFINNAILERPNRKFTKSNETGFVRQTYLDTGRGTAGPTFNTDLRLFARDATLRPRSRLLDDLTAGSSDANSNDASSSETGSSEAEDSDAGNSESETKVTSNTDRSRSQMRGLVRPHPQAGIGGWNDDSDTIRMFRDVLRSESGIEIPKSSLVVRSLGIYLMILVPLNYIVFRPMRRLEYAWMAVPVIAIGGAIWVARVARLDIGFARSQTEIALLETHADHSRGHLCRVVAIYNSLSTRYDTDFKTIDAAARPIQLSNAEGDASTTFLTSFKEGPTLAGLVVGSNQIRLMHTEQIVDLGGDFSMPDDDTLMNTSELEVFDALALRRNSSGEFEVALIGGLAPGSQVGLQWKSTKLVPVPDELPMQMYDVLRRMASPAIVPVGAVRLIGRIETNMGGMTITPSANQTTAHTVLLAHLKHPARSSAKPDENLVTDFREVATDPLGEAAE